MSSSQAAVTAQKSTEYLFHLCKMKGVVPFVGAGMSIPYGFPGWTSFIMDLSREANVEKQVALRISSGQYEEAVDDIIFALGTESVRRKGNLTPSNADILVEGNSLLSGYLSRHFGFLHSDPLRIRGALRILPKLAQELVVTTNFDRVLESAYNAAALPFEDKFWGSKVALIERFLPQRRRVLLKLHGDVEDRHDRVLGLQEYAAAYGSNDPAKINWELPLPKTLRYLYRNTIVLFLGCSLGSDRTIEVLKQIHSSPDGSQNHFAILERPESKEQYEFFARHLSQAGIHPIWYPRGQHDQMVDILKRLVGSLPPLLYAFAIGIVLMLLVFIVAMVIRFDRQPFGAQELAKVDGIAVKEQDGRCLHLQVHYKYTGTDPNAIIIVQALATEDTKGSLSLFPLEGEIRAFHTDVGGSKDGWVCSTGDQRIAGLRACIAKKQHVDPRIQSKTRYFGDECVANEIKCNEFELSPLDLSGQSTKMGLSSTIPCPIDK